MTLTQLEYIIALDRYRHFATAAAKCHITQPTLSIQIQKLEDELGILIFDRSKNPVSPTETGILIIEQARVVLKESRLLNDLVINSREEVKGELKLVLLPSLAPYLLPLFLGSLVNKYPDLKMSIRELHLYQIIGRLQNDSADVGVIVSPIEENGFYEIPVFKEPMVAYLSEDHPLAAKEELELEDIEVSELILTKAHQHIIEQLPLPKSKANHNIKFENASIETIRKVVERQGGITLIPWISTTYMGERRKKYVRPFKDHKLQRQISLIVQRGFHKQRMIDALRAEIIANLPPELPRN